jgi:GIY-YIG catalytic domain
MARTRKIRSDCNYIIYEAVSATGENYIGLTRKTESTVLKSMMERWRKHKSRARNENRLWALYVYLKTGGLEQTWEHRVLEIVRGRAEAYARERELVKTHRPTLNDQYL